MHHARNTTVEAPQPLPPDIKDYWNPQHIAADGSYDRFAGYGSLDAYVAAFNQAQAKWQAALLAFHAE